MTELAPHSSPPLPDVAVPPEMVSIPARELAELRRRANGLRIISRTIVGVVAILGVAAVLIVALALMLDT